MTAKTDYFENKLTDVIWRNQILVVGDKQLQWVATAGAPASAAPTYYVGLLKVAPTDSTAGTEISGGSYARQPLAASLTNMAGTQSAGSTTASTGTNATTSNNAAIQFTGMPDTTGANALVAFGIYDAVSGDHLLEFAALTGGPIQASAGATLNFAAGTLTIQEDN